MSDMKKIGGSEGGSDDEFERDLARSSRAYKAIGDDLPPPAMDDAIRAAARRAVKSKPHAVGKSWVSRWSAPISVAALVMLTVSVVFTGLDEQPDIAPAPVKNIAMPKSAAPSAAPPTTLATPGAGAAQTSQSMEKKARVAQEHSAPRDQLAESRQQDMDRRRSDVTENTASTVASAPSLKEKRDAIAFNAPPPAAPAMMAPAAPAPANPLAKDATGFVAEPPPAQLAKSQENAGAAVAESAKREMAQAKQSQPALAAGAAVGSLRNEVAALPAKKSVDAAAPVAPAPAAPVVASATAVAPPQYAAGPRSQLLADKAEPPEAWLKRILELKQQGKSREFDDELGKFRKRYPDFPLPEELKTSK
ncbi:MAG: hypothetical protein ABL931_07500 [Usitatibacteraceae bacterium]